MAQAGSIDVHQHLWPDALVTELRRRTEPPRLDGWLLHTATEAPFRVDPGHHDPTARLDLDHDRALVLLSLSAPLGIEALPPEEAEPLLNAWHTGLLALATESGGRFAGWASVSEHEPDLTGLATLFAEHPETVVGVQIPAGQLADPGALDRVAPVLQACADAGRPVLVHPGVAQATIDSPPWWPAMVDYPNQLQAAWWTWRAAGRRLVPGLRMCFVAGAGLAPVQHERFAARSGEAFVIDPDVFVDTSSYGRQGVDALVRALGVDALVLGTDRPYAGPTDFHLGEAAEHAITITNPRRLIGTSVGGV